MTAEAGYPTANVGFRDVSWGTGHSEISWEWSDDGLGPMCYVREEEDFGVFGVRASALTYAFRNSVFYGVRIDLAGGGEQNASAEEALSAHYLGVEDGLQVMQGKRQRS